MVTPFTPYQRRLFIFLSVATFFEGYDFLALANILPNLREDFGLSQSDAGFLFAFVNAGTVVAYLLIRRADDWGRRKLMMVTILGYTFFTLLTGFATNVWWFAICQFAARVFLIGEWATAMVYAAEEYPADRRGSVIGTLQAFSSLGAIFCAAVAPMLLATHFGWRTVYFVGVLPLLVLAFARRNLKETTRFIELKKEQADKPKRDAFAVLRGPHRKRVLQLGAIWFLTYICSQTAISFWKDFVVTERGFTDGDVGKALAIASVGAMPMVFGAGKLLDVIGRKHGSTVIFITTSVGVFLAYSVHGFLPLTFAMMLAIFGVSSVLPALNAFTTELFPTESRSDAFAWSNNMIGRIGYVLSPVFVGIAAQHWSWGAAIRPTAIFPLIALVLIWLWLPETNGKELEETAAM